MHSSLPVQRGKPIARETFIHRLEDQTNARDKRDSFRELPKHERQMPTRSGILGTGQNGTTKNKFTMPIATAVHYRSTPATLSGNSATEESPNTTNCFQGATSNPVLNDHFQYSTQTNTAAKCGTITIVKPERLTITEYIAA